MKKKQLNIGESLRLALMYNGLTQSKLADDLGIARSSICKHLKNKKATNPVIKRFADYFDMSVKEFVELGEEVVEVEQ